MPRLGAALQTLPTYSAGMGLSLSLQVFTVALVTPMALANSA